MDLNYKIISDKHELIKYRNDIFELFEHCFDIKIEVKIWEWMYLSNSLGDSIVSLCFDGNKLVGHYGALQLPVVIDNNDRKVLLSVGSMVHSLYRKYGVFVKQGEQLYEYAGNEFACVMGFPNKKALPARKKRLQWLVSENDYVALVTRQQLMESECFNAYLNDNKDVKLDVRNEEYFQWRMAKPGASYRQYDSIIVKSYKENQDIVYINKGYEKELKDGMQYHVLCDGSISDLSRYKVFDYPFGYRVLNGKCSELTFKKDLIMSDVF